MNGVAVGDLSTKIAAELLQQRFLGGLCLWFWGLGEGDLGVQGWEGGLPQIVHGLPQITHGSQQITNGSPQSTCALLP